MMELFDTHAHFESSADDIRAMIERAKAVGVTRIMAVGGNPIMNELSKLSRYRAIGWDREMIGKELPELDYAGVNAIGEIALDYHYSPETREEQLELFCSQLEKARELDLPVVIHTREADDDTLAVLKSIPSKGIIHCFTGSAEFCRKLLDLGFYISISGIVTFRLADNVRESALIVPDDRLLIETDSPFLAPVPKRGSVNEPAFLIHTARFLADLRKMPLEDFAVLTTNNAMEALKCSE